MDGKSFKIEIDVESKKENEASRAGGLLVVVVVLYFFVAILSILLEASDYYLAKWVMGALLGNVVIGLLVYGLHNKFETRRHSNFDEVALKNLGNLFELFLYSFLLSFQLFTLLAGIFIAKMVGDIGKPRNSSSIIAIYRFGIVLQIILVIFCSFFFVQSKAYEEIKKSPLGAVVVIYTEK